MGQLVVEAEGQLTIPSHILAKCGLHGDALLLMEAAEGYCSIRVGLSEEERRQARTEG